YSVIQAEKATGDKLTLEEIPSTYTLKTGHASDALELNITTPDGEHRKVSTTAAPLISRYGEQFGSVTVVTDITERYVLEEQLRQSQKMESIGTLAGGIAHDFNNLLTVIKGFTQIAIKDLLDNPQTVVRLKEVEKAADRAATLTRQLLAFSRRQRLERKT